MFAADSLLVPVRSGQPAGDDLSFSPELDAIAQARKADDPSLDQGEWLTALKEADWDFVLTHCAALLETRSKDLRLAVWLAEAGAKRHQMRGLAEGLLVLAGLCERFWELGLHPAADGDDHEQRIGNLGWILARIPTLLRELPVVDGNGKRYCSIDFDLARKHPDHSELKLADMEAARRASSPAFKTAFQADAQYLAAALQALEVAADRRLGPHSPGFANARDAVRAMLHLMPQAAAPQLPDQDKELELALMPRHPLPGPGGTIASREQALAQLRAVAEFFRHAEPHSPVSYFADKAANAGEQDLHAWLRSVVKDPVSMAHIEDLLGVRPPD